MLLQASPIPAVLLFAVVLDVLVNKVVLGQPIFVLRYVLTNVIQLAIRLVLRLFRLWVAVTGQRRSSASRPPSTVDHPTTFTVRGGGGGASVKDEAETQFVDYHVKVERCTWAGHRHFDGYQHRVIEAGQSAPAPGKTVVLMGGIPSDASETMLWMAADLLRRDPGLRCLILHPPYCEDWNAPNPQLATRHRPVFAKHSGVLAPLEYEDGARGREVVDPRFDHMNQGAAVRDILDALGVGGAVHCVGHDRGAVILGYFAASSSPARVLSLSRGSQVWDYYSQELADLAPETLVGPPHRLFAAPRQMHLILLMVIRIGLPLDLVSEGFRAKIKNMGNAGRASLSSSSSSSLQARRSHIFVDCCLPKASLLPKIRQIMLQTDVLEESRRNASGLRDGSTVPIMQFQGADEFKQAAYGRLCSDQPYFGKYNLFPNDVEDRFPGCIGQDEAKEVPGLVLAVPDPLAAAAAAAAAAAVTGRDGGGGGGVRNALETGDYGLLKLKAGARLSRFALIPDAAHFNVVENPLACAAAVVDFIHDVNEKSSLKG